MKANRETLIEKLTEVQRPAPSAPLNKGYFKLKAPLKIDVCIMGYDTRAIVGYQAR
jgi:hypothetical protein